MKLPIKFLDDLLCRPPVNSFLSLHKRVRIWSFLVAIFSHSEWIQRFTEQIFVFSPNEKKKIRTSKTPKLDTFYTVFNHCMVHLPRYILLEVLFHLKCEIQWEGSHFWKHSNSLWKTKRFVTASLLLLFSTTFRK